MERVDGGEERWHAIGVLDGSTTSNVVHTSDRALWRDDPDNFRPPRRRARRKLSDTQREEVLAVASQGDEDIDYSEIPPVRQIRMNAVRGRFYRGQAIYLTDELHAYLSAIAMRRGVSLNDLVNNVLSREVALAEVLK